MNLASKLGVAALAAALTAGLTVPGASAGNVHAERKAAHKPTLKASASTVVATKKLVLSGKVRPSTKGDRVVLEKRIGDSKKWSTEAKLKVSKKGTYTYIDRPRRAGVRYYRVVVPKVGKVKAGKSKPVKVTVAAWQSLANLPFRKAEFTGVLWNGATIAGTSYSPSIVPESGATQGTADWNIPSTCTSLRVRIGNGDQTDLGAVARITLNGGPGEFTHSGSYGPRQSVLKTFDVRGVFRLTFTWTATTSAGESAPVAQPILARPELLCS